MIVLLASVIRPWRWREQALFVAIFLLACGNLLFNLVAVIRS